MIHAARINGFTVMLSVTSTVRRQESMTPTSLGGTPVSFVLTVTDVDAKFQRPERGRHGDRDQLCWGDRYSGAVADPFGHHWSLGQPVREVNMDEIKPPCHHKGTVSTSALDTQPGQRAPPSGS